MNTTDSTAEITTEEPTAEEPAEAAEELVETPAEESVEEPAEELVEEDVEEDAEEAPEESAEAAEPFTDAQQRKVDEIVRKRLAAKNARIEELEARPEPAELEGQVTTLSRTLAMVRAGIDNDEALKVATALYGDSEAPFSEWLGEQLAGGAQWAQGYLKAGATLEPVEPDAEEAAAEKPTAPGQGGALPTPAPRSPGSKRGRAAFGMRPRPNRS